MDQHNDVNFESSLMFQIISVGGWLLVTMSAIVFFWLSEPCITRVTSRCSQPPSCVLEVGNERTLVSIKTVKRLLKKLSFAESRKENDIVGASFNEWTESLLVEMQLKAKEALRSRSPFTPVIFHGPCGTGKYSAAKHLAGFASLASLRRGQFRLRPALPTNPISIKTSKCNSYMARFVRVGRLSGSRAERIFDKRLLVRGGGRRSYLVFSCRRIIIISIITFENDNCHHAPRSNPRQPRLESFRQNSHGPN